VTAPRLGVNGHYLRHLRPSGYVSPTQLAQYHIQAWG
jgi:hypothetical protein